MTTRALAVAVLSLAAGCSSSAPCPIDLVDSGCVATVGPQCADAGALLPCASFGVRCTLCPPEGSYHSYAAVCQGSSDGGLHWVVERGTAPLGCPPSN